MPNSTAAVVHVQHVVGKLVVNFAFVVNVKKHRKAPKVEHSTSELESSED